MRDGVGGTADADHAQSVGRDVTSLGLLIGRNEHVRDARQQRRDPRDLALEPPTGRTEPDGSMAAAATTCGGTGHPSTTEARCRQNASPNDGPSTSTPGSTKPGVVRRPCSGVISGNSRVASRTFRQRTGSARGNATVAARHDWRICGPSVVPIAWLCDVAWGGCDAPGDDRLVVLADTDHRQGAATGPGHGTKSLRKLIAACVRPWPAPRTCPQRAVGSLSHQK